MNKIEEVKLSKFLGLHVDEYLYGKKHCDKLVPVFPYFIQNSCYEFHFIPMYVYYQGHEATISLNCIVCRVSTRNINFFYGIFVWRVKILSPLTFVFWTVRFLIYFIYEYTSVMNLLRKIYLRSTHKWIILQGGSTSQADLLIK